MGQPPSGPPRERVWEFVVAVSLLSLCVSISLGVVYSVSFFQDSDGMAIPLQSAAQSFVLFACILSTFYLLAHIAAAIRGSKLYDSPRHNIKYEYAPTLDRKFKPFIHILHAWARLLGLLTLLGWISAMAFVTTLFVHRTNAALVASLLAASAADADGNIDAGADSRETSDAEKAMYYLRFDMAACAVGVAGSLALSMMLWCVARPYGVGFYKKHEEEGGSEGGMSGSEVGRKRCSSTTDAGSVMSGETAVSASAGAGDGGGDGGGAGDDELKLKDDGGEKPGPEKHARPQQHVPGGFPGAA